MKFVGSASQSLGMIASNKTVQLGARYENSCADASHLELLVGYQIIQRPLTDREKFSCLLAHYKAKLDRRTNRVDSASHYRGD